MVRKTKALAPLLVVLALGVFGLLLPDTGSVAAQATPSATRSLSATSVAPGAQITVTIDIDHGGITDVVEKLAIGVLERLPDGFTYVSNSLGPDLVTDKGGGAIGFAPLGESSFTYTVTASSAPGSYTFSGSLSGVEGVDPPPGVGGDSAVMVEDTGGGNGSNGGNGTTEPGTPSASRSLSATQVGPGAEVMVTIDIDYAGLGPADKLAIGVVEMLPTGFTYVSNSLGSDLVTNKGGGTYGFAPLGETSFTYTVTAPSTGGSYTFSGSLTGVEGVDSQPEIGGDSAITVDALAPSAPSASRSLPAMYVDPGAEVVVTIDIDYVGLGPAEKLAVGVVETLPAGFTYVSNSLGSDLVTGKGGGTYGFAPLGVSSFTYTVTASSDLGSYTFSGTLEGVDSTPAIGGDSTITVGTAPDESPTPTPEPSEPEEPKPTRTPRPASAPPTPVAIEKVDVTAVEGATAVEPDASAVISSDDGMATVMLPNTSRARTYQVMVSSDAAGCSGGDLAGSLQACATVTVYDAEGNMESGVTLIRRATVVMTLSAAAVEELGGMPVVFQANALGAFSVHQRDDANDSWSSRRFTMGLTEDGGVSVNVTSLRSLGSFALVVDDAVLEQAYNQVHDITPTPVVVPAPVATATPEPTATPVPTPTPVPDEPPPVGDTSLPVGLLVVLALTGALMAYTGSRVMRGRRRSAAR